MLILEAVVPALADPDPYIGPTRPLVLCAARVGHGQGVEGAKPPDATRFCSTTPLHRRVLAERKDMLLYRRIVVSFSWHQ